MHAITFSLKLSSVIQSLVRRILSAHEAAPRSMQWYFHINSNAQSFGGSNENDENLSGTFSSTHSTRTDLIGTLYSLLKLSEEHFYRLSLSLEASSMSSNSWKELWQFCELYAHFINRNESIFIRTGFFENRKCFVSEWVARKWKQVSKSRMLFCFFSFVSGKHKCDCSNLNSAF